MQAEKHTEGQRILPPCAIHVWQRMEPRRNFRCPVKIKCCRDFGAAGTSAQGQHPLFAKHCRTSMFRLLTHSHQRDVTEMY